MIKFILFITTLSFAHLSMAAAPVAISPLGVSPKGQFVALEEVGKHQNESHYVRIRIFNTWKKEFIGETIHVHNAKENLDLSQLKNKARHLARNQFKIFNING